MTDGAARRLRQVWLHYSHPVAFKASRTLVVAPGLLIAKQLQNDFDPALADMFYIKCGVLQGQPFPEPVEIRGTTTNRAHLEEADVVTQISTSYREQGIGGLRISRMVFSI